MSGPLAIDRVAEGVDDAAEQLGPRHLQDAAGCLDRVALAQVLILASTTAPTESRSRLRARPKVARQLDHFTDITSARPCTRTMPSDTEVIVPRCALPATTWNCWMRLLISSLTWTG